MKSVFDAAGGMDGLRRLADAWHRRVMDDEVVSHAFSHGFHADHVERLAAYWAEALGGPSTYSSAYGDETSVVRMHSGNGEHDEMDRLAIACYFIHPLHHGKSSTGRACMVTNQKIAVSRRLQIQQGFRAVAGVLGRTDKIPGFKIKSHKSAFGLYGAAGINDPIFYKVAAQCIACFTTFIIIAP